MEFLRLKSFKKVSKQKTGGNKNSENVGSTVIEEPVHQNGSTLPKATDDHPGADDMEDEDDDFITNEVKRRLKELRKNSFMVLIPEESCPEEEEEASPSENRDSEREDVYPWCGFDTFYEKYCERMLFFDKISSQQLQQPGSQNPPSQSPKSATKLALTLRSLSFKKKEDLQNDSEPLQQKQQDDPSEILERAYVAHVCLTWEALHCQYMDLFQKMSSQPDNPTSYGRAVQDFQQFQVLLQRFIENEPFEDGPRPEIFARARCALPKLLQVPNFHVSDEKERQDDLETHVPASNLAKIIGECILTFHEFLKGDQKKSNGTLNLFGDRNNVSSLQQIQSSFDKKEVKIKELFRKKKSWKKKCWPDTQEEVYLLFGLIDIKVVSRVLRMVRISKEQLLWCEEKICKLDISQKGLHRYGSPVLFPC